MYTYIHIYISIFVYTYTYITSRHSLVGLIVGCGRTQPGSPRSISASRLRQPETGEVTNGSVGDIGAQVAKTYAAPTSRAPHLWTVQTSIHIKIFLMFKKAQTVLILILEFHRG